MLKELFQLDQPELDFGLYRVMHAKSAETTQFLENDLLPQIRTEFEQYKTADKEELEKELAKVIEGVETAGLNPDDSPTVKDLRDRLKHDTVDLDTLESEVYEHLFGFFRRYYSDTLKVFHRLEHTVRDDAQAMEHGEERDAETERPVSGRRQGKLR